MDKIFFLISKIYLTFVKFFIFISMEKKLSKSERNKLWYQANREKILERTKEYRKNYSIKNREKNRKYQENLRREKGIKPRTKLTSEERIIARREYYKNKYANNPLHKLKTNIKNLIGNSLRRGNFKKLSKTEQILGCTYEEFKQYIETLWQPWMNWENKGDPEDGVFEPNKTWDIDHIIPLDTAKCEADLIRLNHYTNLQPLCTYYNRFIKRDKQ